MGKYRDFCVAIALFTVLAYGNFVIWSDPSRRITGTPQPVPAQTNPAAGPCDCDECDCCAGCACGDEFKRRRK